MTRWSSHSEAILQAAFDDVDWDMFRASSSDVSEFTDVALSFVNTLTEQATETVTIRTFSNQKPWVDSTESCCLRFLRSQFLQQCIFYYHPFSPFLPPLAKQMKSRKVIFDDLTGQISSFPGGAVA